MTPPCLLFDLDGTLVDSLPDLTTAINLLRADFDLSPLSISQVRACVGDGATLLVQRALPQGTFNTQKLSTFLSYYQHHLCEQTRPYPGIVEMLQRLQDYPMAIVTNKPVQMATRLLADLDLAKFFKLILGGDSCTQKKPHPAPLLNALTQLQASPHRSLMIGDHHTDLHAALAAQIPACFCTWGYGNNGGTMPDFTVSNVDELQRLLTSR